MYVALALIALAAVGLAYLALSGVHIGNRPTPAPVPDSTAESEIVPSVTATAATETDDLSVGFVGDVSQSWWNGSIDAGLIPGVSSGPRIGQPGNSIAELQAQLDGAAITQGQLVAVQAGTQDIVNGATAAEIDSSIKALWQSIRSRGGEPIAVLIPPSNVFPGSVVTVNNQIRSAAQLEGVAVLDVTSPVVAVDGTWTPGYSDDGEQPNASGATLMIEAAVSQFTNILGTSNVAR
ncbi:SGNH/GDSL hydrolase family protein [Agreia sp. Leaf244]|uniref:SGNH/GDSL hydrolase family protein n=1 Tax=Agreia sp. Leaf244 TaxID=1736305 RepID=UPI00138F56E1|nr:SGNH/GDSL hydrolase family protein [Agreia sp. Leaf244]